MHIEVSEYKSPHGELLLGAFQDKLCLCDWKYRKQRNTVDQRLLKKLKASFVEEKDSDVISNTKKQLEEYFNEDRRNFDIPLLLVGTDFQKTVWEALQKIPYGKTSSYQELSEKLKNPLAIRAIASANGANAISIMIPCHRVIGSDGSLTGYAGGLIAKEKLLQLEGAFNSDQLKLF